MKTNINGMSSKLIPKKSIPIFGGIKRVNAKIVPIIREFIFINFAFSLIVGPAGLEPATDGL